jgi:3-deoxy-D-manno-octulosonic-acid transferase
VRLALVNARLSDKSFRRYVKYRRYLIDIINNIDLIAAGSLLDYDRFRSLGLPPGKLHLTGNLKIDRLLDSQKSVNINELRLVIQGSEVSTPAPVFLAASTHPGEEEQVLESYQNLRVPYPALLLLLAPRHPERAEELGRLLLRRGLPFQLWSGLKTRQEPRRAPVVLIDTVGDLFTLYGVADVAFVGGSLVPHGGQNLLEPAAWGLVPIYGPHINNFRWAQVILESARAGIMVRNAPSLTAALRDLLDHPKHRRNQGQRARDALTLHQGAARRQAEFILGLCEGKGEIK